MRAFLSAHESVPWRAVCDEYRTALPAALQREYADVLNMLVVADTSLKQGRVRVHLRHAGVVPLEAANCEFFAHPVHGTLLRNTHYVSPEKKEQDRAAHWTEELHSRMREVSRHAQAHRIDGCWYLAELGRHRFALHEQSARPERTLAVFDAALSRHVNAPDRFDLEQAYGRRGVYDVHKRELSYRELRDLGLLSPSKA